MLRKALFAGVMILAAAFFPAHYLVLAEEDAPRKYIYQWSMTTAMPISSTALKRFPGIIATAPR